MVHGNYQIANEVGRKDVRESRALCHKVALSQHIGDHLCQNGRQADGYQQSQPSRIPG